MTREVAIVGALSGIIGGIIGAASIAAWTKVDRGALRSDQQHIVARTIQLLDDRGGTRVILDGGSEDEASVSIRDEFGNSIIDLRQRKEGASGLVVRTCDDKSTCRVEAYPQGIATIMASSGEQAPFALMESDGNCSVVAAGKHINRVWERLAGFEADLVGNGRVSVRDAKGSRWSAPPK